MSRFNRVSKNQLKIYITSLRDEDCSGQKVVLIHDNARPHSVQLIKTLLKDFHWEQFKHPLYSLDLVLSDYHLILRLKKVLSNYHLISQLKIELGGQRFQT